MIKGIMPARISQAWNPTEDMAAVDLNDRRLNVRAQRVLARALAAPGDSFPEMMYEDAELEGLYRLVNNDEVSAKLLLAPHYAATARRVESATGPVIVAHDTTAFSFGGEGERDGVGTIANDGTGLAAHVTLATTFDGRPLGVLNVETYTRLKKNQVSARSRPPEERESARWARGLDDAMARIDVGARARVVHVMDREADAYLLLVELISKGHRFVVRLSQLQRMILDEHGVSKITDAIAKIEATTTREVQLSPRSDYKRQHGAKETHPARNARVATLAIGGCTVTLKAGKARKHAASATLTVNVVRVWEPHPVDGEPPVEWMLFTSLPVATAEQLAFVVDCYCRRWVIEEFFKALKTGCAYETRQLESRHALENALAIFVPIAAHLLLLRSLARTEPDLPATTVFSRLHLEVLCAISRRFKLSKTSTIREALFAIAGLGGFLKRNGEPGWLTLGRGHERLLEALVVWKAAKGLA